MPANVSFEEAASLPVAYGTAHRMLITHDTVGPGEKVLVLGASGGVETIVAIQALRHSIAPPTINLDHPDPLCDLDYVPKTPRDQRIRTVMNNSFGFGGHNAAIVLGALR